MIDYEKVKTDLVNLGIITETDFESVKKEAAKRGEPIENILVDWNYIEDVNLGKLIASSLNYNFIELRKTPIQENILKIVPELVSRKQGIIAFERDKEGIKLAMADPENLEIIKLLEKKTGEKIIPYYVTPRDIEETISKYHKEIREELRDIIGEYIEEIGTKTTFKPEALPVIKITETLLKYAYENNTSDLHLEPHENESTVRFRIDGILHDVISFSKNIHDLLIARIKIMSKLRTDEHMAAQDGRFEFFVDKEKIDVRVSILPLTKGEKAVLRLLYEKARRFNIDDLGMWPDDLEKIKEESKKPWGMILATGPTGCGKTTTIYAILKILNNREVSISTIEDPVEYDIEGVNQIQVNPKTNLTFAAGLKAIIRQNPDIIFIGEIRDAETGAIAVNAAMTGHIVLSTLHTNDAATAIPRFLEMEVEPFLIASTVNVVIAQRLVRKICGHCIESYEIVYNEIKQKIPENLREKYNSREKITLYRGKGCDVCSQTGYMGRVGIFEVMEMAPNIKDLITMRADADKIKEAAIRNGMTTMFEDGLRKVFSGITTIDEVFRATRE